MLFIKLGATAMAATLLLTFSQHRLGSIKGTVMPLDAGVRAWAESATDTLRAPILNGSFEISDAKPGAYKIVIEAKPPYRNIARDGIMVTDGQETDAGEIKLDK
jgi:hypothetical protein